MSYHYKSKSDDEIEALAQGFLAKHPASGKNGMPDIEFIIEKLDIMIIPKPGLTNKGSLEACFPPEGKLMFVDADLSNDLPHYRGVLAEEISHRLLEPQLCGKEIPKGAGLAELAAIIHKEIEGDANRLALAILMPKKTFAEKFERLRSELSANNADGSLESLVVESLSKEFELTFDACASRAKQCGLSKTDIKKKELPGGITL